MTPAALSLDLDLSLQPKQWAVFEAITNPNGPGVIGYGGSRGCAKSECVRRCALTIACSQPKSVIWVMRRHWDALEKNHVDPLFQQYPALRQYYHAQRRELRIPHAEGHSSIFFQHAGDLKELLAKTRGPEAGWIFLDQAEDFFQNEIELLDSCNRVAGAPLGTAKKVLTFNPGGVGNSYLRRVFCTRDYLDNEDPNNFTFVQGRAWDNHAWFRGLGTVSETDFYHSPRCACRFGEDCNCEGNPEWDDTRRFEVFIRDTDYGRKLNALPPAERAGDLMGDFENFSGQYFQGAWEEKSIVLDPVDVAKIVKPWWKRWLGSDWGFVHIAATGWFASGVLKPSEVYDFFGVESVNGVRVIVLYRELCAKGFTEPALANEIAARTPEGEKRELRYHWIGHDCWAKRGSANTIADQMDSVFAQRGMPRLDKADIDRVGGARLLYNAMESARRLRNHDSSTSGRFEDRAEDTPCLFISSECAETIKALPTRVMDSKNYKDVLKVDDLEDNLYDMLRYGVKSYQAADPGIPVEVERAQILQRYENQAAFPHGGADANMTNKMLALRKFEAEQENSMHLRRKLRR